MKQHIAATMLIALLPLSLAACGGQKSDSASTTPSAEASTSAAGPHRRLQVGLQLHLER